MNYAISDEPMSEEEWAERYVTEHWVDSPARGRPTGGSADCSICAVFQQRLHQSSGIPRCVGQALAAEAITECIRSGGVWEAESNIKLLGLVPALGLFFRPSVPNRFWLRGTARWTRPARYAATCGL